MKSKLKDLFVFLVICLSVLGCGGEIKEVPEIPIINENDDDEGQDEPEIELFIPDNCSNPPKELSFDDGFKCKPSETRGGSVVCLLPHQFTWREYKQKNDGRNTFFCNANDEHFDDVKIFLRDGRVIELDYAGCHNPVFLSGGKIGRQHFRNENIQWNSSISRRAEFIQMSKGNRTTCLKF